MNAFPAFWQECAAAATQQFSTSAGDFFLADHWPFLPIKRALGLIESTNPGTWKIHAITTAQVSIEGLLGKYARDVHGRLALPTQHMAAFYDTVNGIVRVYDYTLKYAAIICRADHVFPEWELHSPFREFFHIWALEQGGLLVHSGVVCRGERAVLMPAAGGRGKSTTVLSCLQAGMTTTGDDYNLVLPSMDGFTIAPLYANIKMKDPRHFDFAVLDQWPHETLSYASKTIYYPPPDACIWNTRFPQLLGILCPEKDNPVAQCVHISPGELLRTIAVSSVMQSPYRASDYMARASTLASRLKSAKLLLSRHLPANVGCISQWMEQA